MRIWLDMANSPHPVLLGPVAEDLRARGHEIVVTTRDHGQTLALTRKVWPDAAAVGLESPGARAAKAGAIGRRIAALRHLVRGRQVDIAVSLNSYAQIMAAASLRIPAVTLMDYEYQPANHLAFRMAQRVMVPMAFPAERLAHYGARTGRVVRFAGFKEEMYLGSAGGTPTGPRLRACAVFRPPPEGALYHRAGNAGFDDMLEHAAARGDVDVLLLPRLAAQRVRYRAMPGVRLVEASADGPEILRQADVFIGAGGTMSREAALLGVRAYTLFAGRLAAVDRELIRLGCLIDLRHARLDAVDWTPRARSEQEQRARLLRERGRSLRAQFVAVIERAATLAA